MRSGSFLRPVSRFHSSKVVFEILWSCCRTTAAALLLRDPSGRHLRDLPYFIWHECNAQRPYDDTAKRHGAIIDETGAVIDDETTGRLIVMLQQRPRLSRDSEWVAIWAAPVADHQPTSPVKFVVTGADGAKHESSLFRPTDRGPQGKGDPCP
jgi:hypothetical protein